MDLLTKDILLMVHLIGLGLAVGAGVSGKVLAKSLDGIKMEKAKLKFIYDTRKVSMISDVGVLMLLISGITLVVLQPAYAQIGGVFFHVKMALVLLVFLSIGGQHMMRAKLKRTNDLSYFNKVQLFSSITGVSALLTIIMAVLAFH